MTLWLRSRRPERLAAAVVGTWAISYLFGGLRLPDVLDLTGLGASTPLAVLTPLGTVIAVSAALPRRAEAHYEVGSSRPLAVLDTLLVLASVAGVCVLAGLTALTVGWDLSDVVARNTAGYVGLALISRAVLNADAGPLVPVGLCIVSLVMGNRPGGSPHPWAWPIELDMAAWSATVASVALAAGLATMAAGDGGLLRLVHRFVATWRR